ncbi:hypothetical protein MC7420_1534 [Coleofasciculus chthonoplastes PCC 7420]|uniref:Uncharacterized protein n=1 Tax=Coleofasciculus chthonoplastes PCC 7420 TaxID=118168 RepID=B4W4U9_9CYAN|nr:hypothetical protein MC7420_1534 [Coleofasciculus chthonoplastes PCC 7420]
MGMLQTRSPTFRPTPYEADQIRTSSLFPHGNLPAQNATASLAEDSQSL